MMLRLFKTFRANEDGAITVDWVVLTAAIVGLGVAAAMVIGQATADRSAELGSHISTVESVEF